MQRHFLKYSVMIALVTQVAAVVVVASGTAQAAQPPRPLSATPTQDVLQRLGWMVGTWEGSGWVETAESGSPRQFSYSLNVRPTPDGRLLVVDGVGHQGEGTDFPYAEHFFIFDPPPALLPAPPGTFLWMEVSAMAPTRANEAHTTERSLQVGYGFSRQECNRFVSDPELRTNCSGGEPSWQRVTIAINEGGEWVQTREWMVNPADDRSWHTYFRVVLRRTAPGPVSDASDAPFPRTR